MTTTAAGVTRIPVAIPAAFATAWMVAIAAQATGRAGAVHHHTLLEGSQALWAVVALTGLAWRVPRPWLPAAGVIGAAMIYEKTGRHGRRLAPVTGVALLGLGVLVMWQPEWLPASLLGEG